MALDQPFIQLANDPALPLLVLMLANWQVR
jgi:hypothetical protein